MLTIGRKRGEYIVINDNIVVTVDEDDVIFRVSIDAPREVRIVRGEVYEEDRPRPACLDAELRRGRKAKKAADKKVVKADLQA